jgi:hypothetical protein
VEWLHQKHEYINWLRNRDEITAAQADKMRADALSKAKSMEKEQVEQAYSDGLGNGMHFERGDATESVLNEVMYYTQNYGGEKSQAEAKERAANYMRLKGALDEENNQTK